MLNSQLDFEFILVDFYVNGTDYISELSTLDVSYGTWDVDALANVALIIPDLNSTIESYLDFQPTDEGLEFICAKVNYDFSSFLI